MEQKDSVVIFTWGCDNVESKFVLQSWLEVTLLASPRHVGEWQKDWHHARLCTALPYHCTVYSVQCTSLTLSLYSVHLLPYHCTAKILALRNHNKSETVQNIPNFCLKLARLFNEIKIWLIKGKM